MIVVSDYYKKNTPSLSNSKELDISLDKTAVFPEDGIYVGDFTTVTGHKAPALIPIEETNGICFLETPENRQDICNTMQMMALRLAATISPKLCKFTLYDPTGLGANLISLVRLSSEIKGNQIITEPEAFKRELAEAKKSIPETIQNVLGYQFLGKTLIDYNEAVKDLAKPYHFIFIVDFPATLNEDHQALIEDIVRNGKKAGIFIIMGIDTAYESKGMRACNPLSLLDSMTTIYPVKDRYYIKNLPNEKFFNKFHFDLAKQFPSQEIIEELVNKINYNLKKGDGAKIELADILTEANFWSRTSGHGIEVPIGKAGARVIQNLELSTEDGVMDSPHHGVVGGATGSGKTVLLHDIICNAAWLYSPKELQFVLLDFKEGTEFKVYENLPHVKILSTRSELEYAKSVFEYLDKEISRRGDLFKSKSVSNIGRYNEVADEPLPRILLIIDEFQKLLDGDYRSATYFGTTLEDFGRRARSFGINMLLSTQSLAGVDFRHAMSQFGLRIVMKLNSARDCSSFLDDNNYAPYTDLTRKGEAVYNARGGLLNGNVKFQAAYIGETRLLNLISRLNDASIERFGADAWPERYIYDGASAGDYDKNPELAYHQMPNDTECTLFIGEPCALTREHIRTTLIRKRGSNVLAVGKDTDALLSFLDHSIQQVINQSGPDSKIIILDNSEDEISDIRAKYITDTRIAWPDEESEIISLVDNLGSSLSERKDSSSHPNRCVVFIHDLSGIREFKKADRYSPAPKHLQILQDIINDGPSRGMHVVMLAQTYSQFAEMFESALQNFDTRIEMKGGEGFRLFKNMDERNAVKREYQANVLLPKLDEPIRVKLYKK